MAGRRYPSSLEVRSGNCWHRPSLPPSEGRCSFEPRSVEAAGIAQGDQAKASAMRACSLARNATFTLIFSRC